MGRAISMITLKAIKTLGNLIKVARKTRGMSQAELVVRLNVNIKTIRSIETGANNVAIATVFEAAYVLGIPLLGSTDSKKLQKWQLALSEFEAILPMRTPKSKTEIDDDF